MVKCTKRQIRQLKTALHWKMPEAQRQRIQMILLRESGIAQPAIADAMGVSLSTVNRAHMAYDHGGIKALKPKPNGRLDELMPWAWAAEPSASRPVIDGSPKRLEMDRSGEQWRFFGPTVYMLSTG
jgi:Winged helix-turn helix